MDTINQSRATTPAWLANYNTQTVFEINSATRLIEFSTFVNNGYTIGGDFYGKKVVLSADILLNENCRATEGQMVGASQFVSIGAASEDGSGWFAGEFDGQGHTISGIYNLTNAAFDGVGFFAGVKGGAYVHSFLLKNSYFASIRKEDAVAIIPYVKPFSEGQTVRVESVYVDSDVYFKGVSNVGGIVGQSAGDATYKKTMTLVIENCVFAGTAKATYTTLDNHFAGGIIANANGCTLRVADCLSIGKVQGGINISGIVGRSDYKTTITRCVDFARLSGATENYGYRLYGGAKPENTQVSNCLYLSGERNGIVLATAGSFASWNSNQSVSSTEAFIGDVSLNYKKLLSGWCERTPKTGVTFDIIIPGGVLSFAPASAYAQYNIQTLDGAQVRLNAPTGMRFITQYRRNYYYNLVSIYGAENVTLGALIAPRANVIAAGAFTVEALNQYATLTGEKTYFDVEAEKIGEDALYYTMGNVISDIQPESYEVQFSAIGYIKIVNNGQVFYEYSPCYSTRKVSEVAWGAIADVRSTSKDGYRKEASDSYFKYQFSPYTQKQRDTLLTFVPHKPIADEESDYATPESVGLSSDNVVAMIEKMMENDLATHSIMVMRHGKIIAEKYADGYDETSLQRMYSTSKSFVSVSVGMLINDPRYNVKLSDPIGKYYPEYKNANSTIRNTTIEQLLKMSSPFNKGVYSVSNSSHTNWVDRFFTSSVDKLPGSGFWYDTAATHVLGTMVQRVSGKDFLTYMIDQGLDQMGFDNQMNWCVNAPEGLPWGGSGVMCTTKNLMSFAKLVMSGGRYQGTQLVGADYISAATSKQISDSPNAKGAVDCGPISGRGYGYQIWITDNGFAFEGMGNQLAYCVPELDMILVCTSDNQGHQYSYEKIFDLANEFLWSTASDLPLGENASGLEKLNSVALKLPVQKGNTTSPMVAKINQKTYSGGESGKITSFSFDFSTNTLTYTCHGESGKTLTFGLGENVFGTLNETGYSGSQIFTSLASEGKEGYRTACSGAWVDENTFILSVQVVDDYLANLKMTFKFSDDGSSATLSNVYTAEGFLGEYKMTNATFVRR